jgi:hypothetical protein
VLVLFLMLLVFQVFFFRGIVKCVCVCGGEGREEVGSGGTARACRAP